MVTTSLTPVCKKRRELRNLLQTAIHGSWITKTPPYATDFVAFLKGIADLIEGLPRQAVCRCSMAARNQAIRNTTDVVSMVFDWLARQVQIDPAEREFVERLLRDAISLAEFLIGDDNTPIWIGP